MFIGLHEQTDCVAAPRGKELAPTARESITAEATGVELASSTKSMTTRTSVDPVRCLR